MAWNMDGDALVAEDQFLIDVQVAIHNLMEHRGVSRADLARALEVSESRVSQMFSDSASNMTLRTIARVFHALGQKPQITSPLLQQLIPISGETQALARERRITGGDFCDYAVVRPLRRANDREHFSPWANDNASSDGGPLAA